MPHTSTSKSGDRLAMDQFLLTSALYLGLPVPVRKARSHGSYAAPRLTSRPATRTATGRWEAQRP